jgi:outer membrane protein
MFAVIVLLFTLNVSWAIDLKTLYNEAKIHNAGLKDVVLNRDMTEQRKNQLRSATLPTLTLNASFIQLNQARDFRKRGLDDTPETISIRGVQRIFSGLKEIYTLQSMNSLISAEEYRIKSFQLDLLSQVSQIYFQIYLQQERIKNLQELVSLSIDRENLLKQRVRIGKSRNTELRQAKVQTNLHQINLQESKMLLETLWNDLSTTVGKKYNPETLSAYIPSNTKIENLDHYLARVEQHPLVLAQTAQVHGLEKEKNSWQSDYFPTINLTGTYYALAAQNWAVNPEWDFGLTISYPIFEGGLTRARVAESALKVSQGTNQLSQLKLSLENQIKNVHQTLLIKNQQQKAIDEIVMDNKNNFNEIKKEFAIGLVTNLDVITAMNVYVESLNQQVENSISLQLNYVYLKSLIGDEL